MLKKVKKNKINKEKCMIFKIFHKFFQLISIPYQLFWADNTQHLITPLSSDAQGTHFVGSGDGHLVASYSNSSHTCPQQQEYPSVWGETGRREEENSVTQPLIRL